jgi:two-component system, OmpR family, sensor histidine kinase MtrB
MDGKLKIEKKGIRRFIWLWMGALAVCLVVMTAALAVGTNRIQSEMQRVFRESTLLEAGYNLVVQVQLTHHKNNAMLRQGNSQRVKKIESDVKKAESSIKLMRENAGTAEQRRLIDDVERRLAEYRAMELDPNNPERQDLGTQDALIREVRSIKNISWAGLRQSRIEAMSTKRRLDMLMRVLNVLAAMFIIFGAVMLYNRIVQPTMGLVETARRFGRGDTGARAKVFRTDELGMLCRTFNSMADDVVDAERGRRNCMAAVAHDIATPMTIIGVSASRMNSDTGLTAEQRTWMQRIERQTEHLAHMVHDMMDALSGEQGGLLLEKSDIELVSFVRGIGEMHYETTAEKRVVFEGDGACRVRGDAKRLERVIANLLSNAVKYSPVDSKVTLGVERRGDRAVIRVRDRGVGISAEDMPFLFQPFSRLGRTEKMARGTGLGLFSVKRIIDEHGGNIEVISGNGDGTIVEIALPAADAATPTGTDVFAPQYS